LRVSGQSAHEGAAFGGTDREPIELLRRRGSRSLKPVSVGSFREPSLTTASIPGVSQQKPLLNPFPPADVAAVHRRRQRALSPAQTPEQTPLYRASSSMPILRSLGGSAVSCSSFELPLEPRGVPAVQIVPLMSSVYRGRNDADRVEEVVSGPPADSAFLPVFLPVDRSSSPAVHPVITPGYHRCVASPSASRVSSGLGREPFEVHFPSSFPPFARQR